MKKKTRLYTNMRDFSLEYNSINVDGILDFHKYLMKKLRMK